MRYLQFGEKKTTDFGLIVQSGHVRHSAQRDRTLIHVPGGLGDLTQDNGGYLNYDDPYSLGLRTRDIATITAIRSWLDTVGRQKLIDSLEPDYFRLALCTNAIDIEPIVRQLGQFTATFNCNPQRYRLDGDMIQLLTSSGTLTNPESKESLPYIKIAGSGDINLHINDQTIVLTGVSDYIEIDSQLKSCFKGLVLQNTHYRSDFWPVLNVGENQISWEGTVSKVEIKPRWWTL
jgi:phage-related protein